MNLVSNLYLTIAIIALGVGFLVFFNSSNKKLAKLFLLFTIAGCYWGFTGFLLRSAISFDQAYFFQRIGGLWPFCIAIFTHFGLYYSYPDTFIKHKTKVYLLLYAPALFFSFIETTTNQITFITRSPLGFWTSTVPDGSVIYMASTSWSWTLSSVVIILVLQYAIRQRNKKRRRQASFIFLGLSTPVLLSTLSETVFPLLSYPILKMTVPGFGLGLIFIGYAIYKYELFEIDPTVAADQIISTMQDFLILTDRNKKIQTINPSAENLLKYKKNELIGQKIDVLLQSEDSKYILDMNQSDLNQKNTRFKSELISKDNQVIPVDVSKNIVNDKDRNVQGIIFIGRDRRNEVESQRKINNYIKKLEEGELTMISMLEDLRISQKEVEDLNKNLEQKVQERTKKIQQLLLQKDEFINQLGHDLKNPLGPLLTLLPVLEKREDDPKRKKIFHVVNRNVAYMKNLVTKTIKLARLRSPNCGLHYENINLGFEVQEVLETNKIMFEDHHIDVSNNLPEQLQVKGDKMKIQEVFNNLLNNAAKFMGKNGGRINIDQLPRDDDSVLVSIQDSGIGMTEEQLSRVFNEFYKADSSRHDFDSSGLGMTICKRIIELHGGRIWAESDGPGKGSTFFFTLPKSDE